MNEHTLLLTDLVDSTLVGERLGHVRAAELYADHDRRARELLARHRGREIDRTDGFLLSFENVEDAATYALAYHRAIAELGLSARAGVHVGPVVLHENLPDDVDRGAKHIDAFSLAIPVVARVMALASGRQTLLTAAARATLGDVLPAGTEIESHGYYHFKGIEEPIEVFEFGARDSSPFTPPADVDKANRVVRIDDIWRPIREVRHNLPAERDEFVGRAADLKSLAARLDTGSRLLTVLGAGGTGKTRFARRYGWTWLGDWPGGVYFCDLSEARSLDGICFAVASALEVPLGKGDPAVQLGHAIAGRGRCLVIVDNFEQVVQHAPATIGRWLDRAPDAAFVVTSRERLHLPGEEILAFEPLPLKDDAVELFAIRARAQRTDFTLRESNRAAVAEVVRLLDGLPLAIELAAARARTLSPAQLVERLRDRFALLVGVRGAAARQATLRAAIDWSWDLLAPWEQDALAQCAIFDGGFTIEAAESVLDLSKWPQAPPVMDVVQALVDKSLLRSWIPAQQGRLDIEEPYFGMYLSIYDYAAGKLTESGATARSAAEQRHGAYFAAMGSDAGVTSLYRHGGDARRRALILELDNLAAACRRATRRGDGEQAVGALRAVWEAITTQGGFSLAIELGAAIDAIQAIAPSSRAAALTTTARALVASGRHAPVDTLYLRALALTRDANDRRREAKVLAGFGNALRLQGRMDDARRRFEEALAVLDALGEPSPGHLLAELGIVHRQTGAMDEARAWYQRALAVDREVGDRDAEAKVLNNLAILHAEQGRFDEARARFEDSLALSRELGDRRQAGLALANLGCLNLEQGRLDPAEDQLLAALAIHRDTGERAEESHALANFAGVQQQRGALEEARATCGAALVIAREVGGRRDEGSLLTQIGGIEHEQGRLEQARAAYDEALAIHRALGNRRYVGRTLTSLADLLAAQGRRDEARAALAEGETLLRAIGEKLDLASLLCIRGRLELHAGDTASAAAACDEAERLAEDLKLAADSSVREEVTKVRARIDAAAPRANIPGAT